MAKKSAPDFKSEPGPVLHTGQWRFGPFTLDEGKRELRLNGDVIEAEPKPLNMLMLLLRHPGELVTKNDLMEALWTGRIVTETVLTNCVGKLRQLLGEQDAVKIRNVHGYGYRLETTVELFSALPAAAEAAPSPFSPGVPVPQRPNWQFVRRLGRSGECWLAQHASTGEQRVFKFAEEPRELAALKREVTIYRLLRQTLEDRAPVADLLDWNFDAPPWFLESRYCELGSLQEYLEAQGQPLALSRAERLNLVVQLAQALSLVHSVGILHKDLKPANILVSPGPHGSPRLLLADFGSGRVLDLTQLEALAITRLGFTHINESGNSSSGTPLYYAPEVLSGQPPTLKADVYALGVIFYQLLVGDLRKLFAPGWEREIDDELLREDIEACAASNPNHRLADPALLAERLHQLPQRRIARAQAKAQVEQLAAAAREVERLKARRTGMRLAVAALAVGLAASLLLFWRATVAQREAKAAGERAEAVTGFLLGDVLGKLASGKEPVRNLSVFQLLASASSQLTQHFNHQPILLAQVSLALGNAYNQLGERQQAEPILDAGFAASAQAPAPLQADLAASLLFTASSNGSTGNRLDSFIKLAETLAKSLPANNKGLQELQLQIAYELMNRGEASRALTILELLNKNTHRPADDHGAMNARVNYTLGILYTEYGSLELALQQFDQAIALATLAFGKNHLKLAQYFLASGIAQCKLGKYKASDTSFEKAIAIIKLWEPIPGDFYKTWWWHKAECALDQNDLNSAAPHIKNLSQLAASHPTDNNDVNYLSMGRYALLQGDFTQGAVFLQTGIDGLQQSKHLLNSPLGVDALLLQASAQISLKQLPTAKNNLQIIGKVLERSYPKACLRRALWLKLMGQIAMQELHLPEGEAYTQRAFLMYKHLLGANHPFTRSIAVALQKQSTTQED